MIRTLNFTGRLRLSRDVARITLDRSKPGIVAFEAELNFSGLALPADGRVFIEAAFKTTFMRFAWGTVERLLPAAERRLTRLEQPELAHFRVKVVAPASHGLAQLLAVADRLEPEGTRPTGNRRVSLFRINVTPTLKDEIWRLNFQDAMGPLLELQPISGIKEFIRQESFMALVFPEVVRQILTRVFADGVDDPEDRLDEWRGRWLRFGVNLVGRPPPQLIDGKMQAEHEDWIQDVIAAFSQREKLVSKFTKRLALVEAEVA